MRKTITFIVLIACLLLGCKNREFDYIPPIAKEFTGRIVYCQMPTLDEESEPFAAEITLGILRNDTITDLLWIDSAFPQLYYVTTHTTSDGVTLYGGDSVEIQGFGIPMTDAYGEAFTAIEVEKVTVIEQRYPICHQDTLRGIISMEPNPCTTSPCMPGMDWALLVEGEIYILPTIPTYLEEGDSAQIIGTVCTNIEFSMEEYLYLDIQAIEKL